MPPPPPPLHETLQLRGTALESERLRHFPFTDIFSSVVFIANTLRRTPRVCVIPRAVRKRTYVDMRRWRVAIVNCDSRPQRWSRKGKARTKGSESGKPRRHIGLQKDLGYSRRSCEVRPCLAPANDGATWPFPTSDATWEPQACVQHFLCFFWLVAIRLVACIQL